MRRVNDRILESMMLSLLYGRAPYALILAYCENVVEHGWGLCQHGSMIVNTLGRKNGLYILVAGAIVSAASFVLCLTVARKPLTIAYHQWRMNAEFSTIFGESQPAENGLTAFDVTGTDVDVALERYFKHRQKLVDMGSLRQLSSSFATLKSDGTEGQEQARAAFVQRMWSRFFWSQTLLLIGDGAFQTWIPVAEEAAWGAFIVDETTMNQKARLQNDADSAFDQPL